ncbi:putative metal-dependent hydrolase [Bacillus ectoiniformans]|uniref:DUF309 domain-containing protein n=1 Tax=Bacillus ectoiniformans TaxID=1494429 RepID=UPI0019564E38|nr:DUF309 domain-containing protein [Bacillus ectoiniformans]MBM7648041.1 putative metal-dependent hydrolase [Bacillus ectoiniformans]
MYSYPLAYLTFLVHFHQDQDYFECHEVLEEYWKEKTDQTRDSVWVGLIQTAVSLYHYRRGNVIGAVKMGKKALSILKEREAELEALGIDKDLFISRLSKSVLSADSDEVFDAFSIPFSDQQVVEQYTHFLHNCLPGLVTHKQEFLLNKHVLRDRSDVITAREAALQLRIEKRDALQNR